MPQDALGVVLTPPAWTKQQGGQAARAAGHKIRS